MKTEHPISNAKLIELAKDAMKKAYAPYSGYKVGASLLAEDPDGEISVYTGCNIENASFSPTICAERVAVAQAVKDGYCRIRKLAVCGGLDGRIDGICPPCGVCRQFISEFADESTEIIMTSDGCDCKAYKMTELLPFSFKKDKLLNN